MRTISTLIAIFIASTIMTMGASATLAQDLVITTGSDKGSYFNDFAPLLDELLATRKFPHQIVTSAGTGDNFNVVCANPSNIGYGQANLMPALMAAKPECKIVIMQEVAPECIFGATSVPDLGNIEQVADISFNMTIAVPKQGSGSWLTWQDMTKTMPNLVDAQIIEVEDAAAGVELVKSGKADMVMFVASANPKNEVFKAVNEAGMTFLDMSNADMLQLQIGDTYMYDRLDVTVANAGWKLWKGSTSVATACTKAVIFTGSPDSANLPKGKRFQESLIKLISGVDAATLRPSDDWLTSILNVAADTSRDKMVESAKAAKKFAEENIINLN